MLKTTIIAETVHEKLSFQKRIKVTACLVRECLQWWVFSATHQQFHRVLSVVVQSTCLPMGWLPVPQLSHKLLALGGQVTAISPRRRSRLHIKITVVGLPPVNGSEFYCLQELHCLLCVMCPSVVFLEHVYSQSYESTSHAVSSRHLQQWGLDAVSYVQPNMETATDTMTDSNLM